MEPTDAAESTRERLVCRVTPWYYRRMGMIAGMCVAFGLYFMYDWKFGYPKYNHYADRQDWFEKEFLPSYDTAKNSGSIEEWEQNARANGWPTGRNGEPPKWVQYAALNGWPEKPKRYTQKEIDEQLWWGVGTIAIGVWVGFLILRSRSKTLIAESDHLITPEGLAIQFEHVVRVDKRKWDNKGLATLWFENPPGTSKRKAVIDDLKFAGADQVLARLLEQFKGELIEKVQDEDVEEAPLSEPAQLDDHESTLPSKPEKIR